VRLTRCDVRDHINCRKNNRWRSYRFYKALQRLKSPTCDICEIFGAPRFRSFSTQSVKSGPWRVLERCPLSPGFCCKTPIMPFDQFPANRPNEPQSPIDVALRPLPKSPVSSSLDNVVPQSIVRSPRVRPGKFVFSHAKRLLQQNPPTNRHRRARASGPKSATTGLMHPCADKKIQLLVLPPKSPKMNGAVERCNGAWRYEFYAVYELPRNVEAINPILALQPSTFQNFKLR
jgi:hypothetical protein